MVAGVGDEVGESLHHGLFREFEKSIELCPELLGHGLTCLIIEFDVVKAKDFHDTMRSLVGLLVLMAGKFASFGEEIQVQGSSAFTGVQSNEAFKGVDILL